MKKRRVIPIILIALGLVLVILSGVFYRQLYTAWFWILLVLGLLSLLIGAYLFYRNFKGTGADKGRVLPQREREMPEYRKKRAVLSRPELEFYDILLSLLHPEHFSVLPSIPLVSVIEKLTQNSYRNELFRVVDFCIVDAKTTEPLLLIELNDASHERADRIERDRKVLEICGLANLPIIMLNFTEAADIKNVEKILRRYLT